MKRILKRSLSCWQSMVLKYKEVIKMTLSEYIEKLKQSGNWSINIKELITDLENIEKEN